VLVGPTGKRRNRLRTSIQLHVAAKLEKEPPEHAIHKTVDCDLRVIKVLIEVLRLSPENAPDGNPREVYEPLLLLLSSASVETYPVAIKVAPGMTVTQAPAMTFM
jgi:hypothetical protein